MALQTWFIPGTVIASGDLTPPIDPGTEYRSHWNHLATGEGGPSYAVINAAYYEPLRAATWLGVGEDVFQRLWLTALVALAVGGTVFFVLALTANPVVAGVAAVVAVFNPYRLVAVHEPVSLLTLALAAILGGLVLRAGVQRSSPARPLTFALASLGVSFIFNNPAHVVLVAVWVLASLGFTWVSGGVASFLTAGFFLAKAFPLSLLVNVWWLVPLALTIGSPAFESQFTAAGIEQWAWTHARSSLTNVVALDSSWATVYPEYSPFGDRLAHPPFDVLRQFLPILAVLGVFLSRGRQRAVAVAVAVLAVVFVGIAKGLHPPLGGVNGWLYDNLPGYWLFREPFKVLILLGLALAILAGLGVVRLVSVRFGSAPVGATLAVALVAGALVYVHPLFTGSVIPGERELLPSAHVQVPGAWRATIRELREQPPEGKVLVLPRPDFYALPTTWGYYGPPFVRYAVDRAFLEELPGGYYSSATSVSSTLESIDLDLRRGRVDGIEPKLRALGIGYILLRRDIVRDFPGRPSTDPNLFGRGLSQVPGLKRVSTSDVADVYALPGRPNEVYAATPVAYEGAKSFVPEALAVAPGTALVTSGERDGIVPANVLSGRVSLPQRRTWDVSVRQTRSGLAVRVAPVSARVRHLVRMLSFPTISGRFLLTVGSRASVVDAVGQRWRTVARLAAEGETPVGIWQPRLPRRRDGAEAVPLSGSAEITYEKASTSEFRVRVSDARAPFLLVLTETRAPGWQLEAADRDPGETRPVTVNGYANGWIVPWRGTYELSLVYRPEETAALARSAGLVIVPLALLLWLASLLVPARWRSSSARARRSLAQRLRLERPRSRKGRAS